MIKTLSNALKIKEIRSGLLFTFFVLVVIRLGSQTPAPGIDSQAVSEYFKSFGNTFSFMDSITGGSFSSMSIFALNVTPYITSSIIMQLLTIAIPALEEMQKDGDDGRKKMTAITRYLTIALAIVESLGLAIGFGRSGYLTEYNYTSVLLIIVVLTTGSAFVMWLGERITERGVGNGISIILMINIVSRMPSDFLNLYNMFIKTKPLVNQIIASFIIIAIVILTIVLVVLLQGGERLIPISGQHMLGQNKSRGNSFTKSNTSTLPLKVNTSGVIPIIFASSILSVPSVLMQFFSVKSSGIWSKILEGMNSNYWFNPSFPWASIGLVVYVLLVIFFAYFYTSITFNPMEIANNLKKSNRTIPGIRPGKATQDYLNKVLNHIVFIGCVGLLIIALIPIFFNGVFSAKVSFGGTSLIIIVGVIIETMKQIESKMIVRNYTGFLS